MSEFSLLSMGKQFVKTEEVILEFLRLHSPPMYRQNDELAHANYKLLNETRMHILKQMAQACGYDLVKQDPFKQQEIK